MIHLSNSIKPTECFKTGWLKTNFKRKVFVGISRLKKDHEHPQAKIEKLRG